MTSCVDGRTHLAAPGFVSRLCPPFFSTLLLLPEKLFCYTLSGVSLGNFRSRPRPNELGLLLFSIWEEKAPFSELSTSRGVFPALAGALGARMTLQRLATPPRLLRASHR